MTYEKTDAVTLKRAVLRECRKLIHESDSDADYVALAAAVDALRAAPMPGEVIDTSATTPGPWGLRGVQIRADGGRGKHVATYQIDRADGLLIAEAPTMLVMLQRIASADYRHESSCSRLRATEEPCDCDLAPYAGEPAPKAADRSAAPTIDGEFADPQADREAAEDAIRRDAIEACAAFCEKQGRADLGAALLAVHMRAAVPVGHWRTELDRLRTENEALRAAKAERHQSALDAVRAADSSGAARERALAWLKEYEVDPDLDRVESLTALLSSPFTRVEQPEKKT